MANGLKIGYVDLNLENFHANVYLKHFRNELADRGATVAACFGLQETESRAWAERNNVPYVKSVKAMDKLVDAFVVLAPSNPEIHLALCRKVFPFKKPTYVDKTFAPNAKAAKAIFALADKHGVPMQSTSALRYTGVQAFVKAEGGPEAVKHMVAWGGGRSFGEYSVHPLEIVMSCMGAGVETLHRRGSGKDSQLLLNFTCGRTAVVNVYTEANTPFAAAVTTEKGTTFLPVDASRIFLDMASAMLDLFESGKPNIDRAETLAIRRVQDAAAKPGALKGFIRV